MVSFSRFDHHNNKMAATADVSVTQGGPSSVKLHPYLVTLVRWCVSCLWSTATVLLHRIMIAPLQPITGPKPPKTKPSRLAGTEHLHPEPRVSCELLHHPPEHTLDVIFVHGLYGSLGNTWRQGEWRSKYEKEPKKILLKQHSEKTCNCQKSVPHIDNNNLINKSNVKNDNFGSDLHDTEMTIIKVNEKLFKKIIPKENDLITEQFYNNTLLDQVEVCDNYDTQANFISDLFKRETNCDIYCDDKNNDSITNIEKHKSKIDQFKTNDIIENNNDKCNESNDKLESKTGSFNSNDSCNECNKNGCDKCNKIESDKCKENGNDKCNEKCGKCVKCNASEYSYECKCEKQCEVGCGCICDDCYSSCWPKDWIQRDFPGARVISVNYTSDPYLWRPLWIKENKRLSLHVRAEQMMEQLLAMGVGERPIVWVGHSKGGLFIKQIFCEAFESHKKLNNTETIPPEVRANPDFLRRVNSTKHDAVLAETIDHIVGNLFDKQMRNMTFSDYKEQSILNERETENGTNLIISNDIEENGSSEVKDNEKQAVFDDTTEDLMTKNDNNVDHNDKINNLCLNSAEIIINNNNTNINTNNKEINDSDPNIDSLSIQNSEDIIDSGNSLKIENEMIFNDFNGYVEDSKSSNIEDQKARLFTRSRGFMFYSVPHRGSPLADIKTPVTARSLELLEISKDCPLVVNLQARWLEACAARPPAVRGFVETCRTLMSVLWLTIVSEHSADAGIGKLLGVAVDHREICKPSSRHCMLYTELVDLINEALCDCDC